MCLKNAIFVIKKTVMGKKILFAVVMALAVCSCGGEDKKTEKLLKECEDLYAVKKYDAALGLTDSLRRTYPDMVEVRKKAFALYRHIELDKAQAELAVTDTALQKVVKEYYTLDSVVKRHKADGVAHADELTLLTRKRMRRDTLQVRFDVLCAKIRYIKEKMKQ